MTYKDTKSIQEDTEKRGLTIYHVKNKNKTFTRLVNYASDDHMHVYNDDDDATETTCLKQTASIFFCSRSPKRIINQLVTGSSAMHVKQIHMRANFPLFNFVSNQRFTDLSCVEKTLSAPVQRSSCATTYTTLRSGRQTQNPAERMNTRF